MSGAAKSRASSEIRVYVDMPTGPTAPANLLGLVNGSNLTLSWRNTFGGGAPTSVTLDVTGPLTTTLTLGVAETFSFAGVPPGTYTFSVRATNGFGSSGSSNPVTLTFPTTCSGSPQTPINLFASTSGNTASVTWTPAAGGAAPTRYDVNVTGAYTGRLPTTARALTGVVAPGTYIVSVRAVNPCGNSAFTAAQTITIR
jgi:predicted phage tail protein